MILVQYLCDTTEIKETITTKTAAQQEMSQLISGWILILFSVHWTHIGYGEKKKTVVTTSNMHTNSKINLFIQSQFLIKVSQLL